MKRIKNNIKLLEDLGGVPLPQRKIPQGHAAAQPIMFGSL